MALTYTNVTNPVYIAADNSAILCTVTFDAFPNPLPFTALATDVETHGQEIYAACIAGTYGAIGAYVAPTLTPQQQFNAAISAGVVVASSSTPSLNGTYGIASTDQSNISSEALFISTFQEFTTATDTIDWADASGAIHTFPSTTLFMTFAKLVGQYVSACKQTLIALTSGGTATFPNNELTLD
jgi:hypothetical protein